MSKEKYLQFVASFLIVIVLTIPYYVTGSWAAINSVSVKGSDGVEGFAKLNDFLTFSVQANLDSGKVTKDLIYLGADIKFDQCTASIDNTTTCTLRYPGTGKLTFSGGLLPYTINLYKDSAKQKLDDAKSGKVVIDNLPPRITLTPSKNLYSGQENIIINYQADDFACTDASCAAKCPGIKSIDFYSPDSSFKQSVAPNTTDCAFNSKILIEPTFFKDGKNSVIATLTDNLNQASASNSAEFTIDTIPPIIPANSFVIVRKGISLSAHGPRSVPVDVFINISASDLNPNSVTADLSQLNPSENLKKIKAQCFKVKDDLSTCKWAINLNPGTQSSASSNQISGAAIVSTPTANSQGIVINASDFLGNKASVVINKALALDDKGSVVQSLSTNVFVDNTFFARPQGSTVKAVFGESTGLSPDDVFLYIGNSKQNPAGCGKEPDWTCTWKNVNFGPVAKSTLSIKTDTVDIFDNPVAAAKTVDVIVDGTPPVVTGISLRPVGTLSESVPDLFKVGDKITVEANVTEANSVTAVADFSKFIDGAVNVVGTCKKIEGSTDKNECTFLTEPITAAGTFSVKFNFSDPVGNNALPQNQLTVLGLETSAPPDFWNSKAECSPQTVDRQLGPLISQRVYCSVKLTPKTGKRASTVFVGPANPGICTATNPIAQNIEIFNNEAGSNSPIIKFTLKKDPFKINEANFSCDLNIFSRVDNLITKNPELETANISIKFYNLPLGELSDTVQKQIDDAKNDIKGIWKLIGVLNKFVETAKKICQLINTLLTITASLYIITGNIHKLEATCEGTGILNAFGVCAAFLGAKSSVCGATEAVNKAAETAQAGKEAANAGKEVTKAAKTASSSTKAAAKPGKGGSLGSGLNKFCDFVTCRKTILWGPQVEKWINSWPLADYIGKREDGTTVFYDYQKDKTFGAGNEGRPLSTYLDPRNSIVVATLYGCVPGIISGLEKYRQIKCLYADCVINSVGKDGLPLSVCTEQKSYATCKYVTGELFAVFPYTALFDHFTGIVKDAISNPFTIIGVGASVYCNFFCHVPAITDPSGAGYQFCRGTRIFSQIADSAQNMKSIADTFQSQFKIQQDYCSRIDLGEDETA